MCIRDRLEVLREPLESGRICISRAAQQIEFPARFQLVAAMNPCPCGYLGDSQRSCRCTPDQVHRYRARISGPLLDRIDLQLTVPRMGRQIMDREQPPEPSTAVRQRVLAARRRQQARGPLSNAQLGSGDVERHCATDAAGRELLAAAIEQLGLSARAYHRILKVARSIADLAGEPAVASTHIAEAISLRELDRPH